MKLRLNEEKSVADIIDELPSLGMIQDDVIRYLKTYFGQNKLINAYFDLEQVGVEKPRLISKDGNLSFPRNYNKNTDKLYLNFQIRNSRKQIIKDENNLSFPLQINITIGCNIDDGEKLHNIESDKSYSLTDFLDWSSSKYERLFDNTIEYFQREIAKLKGTTEDENKIKDDKNDMSISDIDTFDDLLDYIDIDKNDFGNTIKKYLSSTSNKYSKLNSERIVKYAEKLFNKNHKVFNDFLSSKQGDKLQKLKRDIKLQDKFIKIFIDEFNT